MGTCSKFKNLEYQPEENTYFQLLVIQLYKILFHDIFFQLHILSSTIESGEYGDCGMDVFICCIK